MSNEIAASAILPIQKALSPAHKFNNENNYPQAKSQVKSICGYRR